MWSVSSGRVTNLSTFLITSSWIGIIRSITKSELNFKVFIIRPPIAPEKEDLLSVNDTSVTIQLNSWKSGGCPITHFEIKYKQQRQKNWILFADRVSSNRKSITISSLSASTWYQLQLTSHNEAGPTEAEYIFTTGAAVK
ncbi:down syndrome cell adhesion molecule-like protein Dscam2, partial [Nephila pilipes]